MNARHGFLFSIFMILSAAEMKADEYINPTYGIPVSEMTEEQKRDVRQQYRQRMAAKKSEAHQLRVARAQSKAANRPEISAANRAANSRNQAAMREQFARLALPYSYVPSVRYRVVPRYGDSYLWGYRQNGGSYVRPYYYSRRRF